MADLMKIVVTVPPEHSATLREEILFDRNHFSERSRITSNDGFGPFPKLMETFNEYFK